MHQDLPLFHFSLLIPCYNNLAGLQKSLQTVRYAAGKCLILIVDDGSEDPITREGLNLENSNLQIQILRLLKNEGITKALNTGLEWISTHTDSEFVARLDCGDLCDPQRFYQQIEYLRVNPDIQLLGSWCRFEDREKKISYNFRAAATHKRLKRAMYFTNAFIHPTVIFRTSTVKKLGLYPKQYPHAEDYALFWKIMKQGKTAVIQSFLVTCEISSIGISSSNRIKQLQSRLVIVREFGPNFVLKILGIAKLRILLKVPHSFILTIKKLISF